jgi:pyruvate,orthophosphate dikinase
MLHEFSAGPVSSAVVCYDEAQAQRADSDVLLVQDNPRLGGLTWPRLPVGLICRRIGPTSHLAVAARSRGLFCAGAPEAVFEDGLLHLGGMALRPGSIVTLTGSGLETDGHVIQVSNSRAPGISAAQCLEFGLTLLCNAESADDVLLGLERGATGVGSIRMEHAILGTSVHLGLVRLIVAQVTGRRGTTAMREIVEPELTERIRAVLLACASRDVPVAIRLLDIDPHEWLSDRELAEVRSMAPGFIDARGIRLADWLPELYDDMLPRALCDAARRSGIDIDDLSVTVPYVSDAGDVERASRALGAHARAAGLAGTPRIGVMIETLDSVRNSADLAETAGAFTLGTNDLAAQIGGYERNDPPADAQSSVVVPARVRDALRHAVSAGRRARPGLVVGVCGEAAREPRNLPVWSSLGIDFVSPGARSIAAPATRPVE